MERMYKYGILTLLFFFGVSVSLQSFSQDKDPSVDEGLSVVEEPLTQEQQKTIEIREKTLEEIAQPLAGAKLKDVAKIVDELENKGGEEILPLFQALVGGNLYYERESKRLVEAKKREDKRFDIEGVFDKDPVSIADKKAIRKVKTNNRLRSGLRNKISRIQLFSKKPDARKEAVANLLGDLDSENIALLIQAQQLEKNKKVLRAINSALAVSQLKSNDAQARLSAINTLSGNLEPIVRNELLVLLEKNDDGSYKESNRAVINAAEKAVASIDGSIKFYGYIETLFFGLSLGSVLLLVAAGLAITFGVMGVINMAHGEMIMLGAYTTYVIQLLMPNNIALSILIAIPAAFIVSASVGILIERGVIQFLKGRPLETLLATFGISLILQQLVRSIFSPLNRQVATPEFMSGAMEINPIFSITYNRLYILLFALIVFFVLQLILKKTSLGLNVRAVSQNRDMAKCMGIRTEWVDAMTFGLGSGIAGLAGVALSQITNVGPNLGQAYIIDSFMVVVFGGVGNLWGTLVGGFSLGVLNKFLEPATGAVLANIIVLVGIILFIQKRPKGLFPQKGRSAE
ncbi:MAG: urea ABC transporter permease subunit UrtB [Cellvibrionaceae bacterium]